jgi:hypothetical protein
MTKTDPGHIKENFRTESGVDLSRRRALRAIALATGAALGAGRAFADSGSSCFVAGTRVLLADGSEKAIEDISIGDALLGVGQTVNIVQRFDHTRLGPRPLFALNGGPHFVTAEHPFLTPDGWKSIDPDATLAENANLKVGALGVGDRVQVGWFVSEPTPVRTGNLMAMTEVGYCTAWQEIQTLTQISASPDLPLFNFLLDGTHSYHADGYIVHNKGDGGGGGGGGGGGSGEGGSNSGSNSSGSNSGSNSSGSNSSGSNSGSHGSGSNSGRGSANSGPGSPNSGPGNASSNSRGGPAAAPTGATGAAPGGSAGGADGSGVGGVGL